MDVTNEMRVGVLSEILAGWHGERSKHLAAAAMPFVASLIAEIMAGHHEEGSSFTSSILKQLAGIGGPDEVTLSDLATVFTRQRGGFFGVIGIISPPDPKTAPPDATLEAAFGFAEHPGLPPLLMAEVLDHASDSISRCVLGTLTKRADELRAKRNVS